MYGIYAWILTKLWNLLERSKEDPIEIGLNLFNTTARYTKACPFSRSVRISEAELMWMFSSLKTENLQRNFENCKKSQERRRKLPKFIRQGQRRSKNNLLWNSFTFAVDFCRNFAIFTNIYFTILWRPSLNLIYISTSIFFEIFRFSRVTWLNFKILASRFHQYFRHVADKNWKKFEKEIVSVKFPCIPPECATRRE